MPLIRRRPTLSSPLTRDHGEFEGCLVGTSDPAQGHSTKRLTLVLEQLLPKAAPRGEDWASGAAAPAKRTTGPTTPGQVLVSLTY